MKYTIETTTERERARCAVEDLAVTLNTNGALGEALQAWDDDQAVDFSALWAGREWYLCRKLHRLAEIMEEGEK